MSGAGTADPRLEALCAACRRLPSVPGVYRMYDAREAVIYVGKARDLRKRVASYFMRLTGHSPKVAAMVRQTVRFEIVATRNENEALLLESNLIKELKPRYNIVLRDDKSYPYIYVSTDQPYPRLAFHRGAKRGRGRYFGPYPNAGAVRGAINLLQKLFMLRHCEDSFFSNRTRPCLQYQIKRCTAPCVNLVAPEEYRADVEHAILFLEGSSRRVIDVLVAGMEAASATLEFERAARYRDQIAKLQRVAAEQHVSSDAGDFDIIVCRLADGVGCVQVFFVRGGRNLGNKTFFPIHTAEATTAEIVEAFLPQFYLTGHAERDIPPDVILAERIEDEAWLATALAERRGGAVRLRHGVRGERARWLEMAQENAELALSARLSADADLAKRIEALRDALDLPESPSRIECFDVSHTRGEATVASCVVFGPEGARKAEYRRFNIEGVAAGDDYAAMRQALERRYGRLQREEAQMPDLLLIDGGKGQVAQALEVLAALQIDDITVIGIAKGTTRKPGLEKLIMHDGTTERSMAPESIALHLIQQIRDEAHRFAITAHRRARGRARGKSALEDIAGIGATRRQRLVQHFGGMQGIVRASVEDLQRVRGISRKLAQTIYDVLHE